MVRQLILKSLNVSLTLALGIFCFHPSYVQAQYSFGESSGKYIPTDKAISNQTLNLFSGRLSVDSQLIGAVTSVGTRLLTQDSTLTSMNWRFHILYDPVPNSFSLPSGDIFVTTGLLDMLQSKDELATVLGREIAFLEEEAGWRAYRHESSMQSMATVAMIAIYGVVMYFQVTSILKAAKENPTEYSTSSPAYTLLYSLAGSIPDEILKMSRNSRLSKARLPAYAMMGREQTPITFDMFLVKTLSEGYGESAELAADRRALDLSLGSGWSAGSQLSVLERLVSSDPTVATHLRSTLTKRIAQAEEQDLRKPGTTGGNK